MLNIMKVKRLLNEVRVNSIKVASDSIWKIEKLKDYLETYCKYMDELEELSTLVLNCDVELDIKKLIMVRSVVKDYSSVIECLYSDIMDNSSENELHVSNYDLSIRLYNVLMRGGIYTIDQIQSMDIKELAKVRNMGKKALKEACQLVYDILGDSTLLKAYDELYLDIDAIIEQIKEANSKVNNRRVVLLINLASNKGATKGEKINSINLCKKILNM